MSPKAREHFFCLFGPTIVSWKFLIDDGYPLIWMHYSTSVFLFFFLIWLCVVFLNQTGLSIPVYLNASKRKERLYSTLKTFEF